MKTFQRILALRFNSQRPAFRLVSLARHPRNWLLLSKTVDHVSSLFAIKRNAFKTKKNQVTCGEIQRHKNAIKKYNCSAEIGTNSMMDDRRGGQHLFIRSRPSISRKFDSDSGQKSRTRIQTNNVNCRSVALFIACKGLSALRSLVREACFYFRCALVKKCYLVVQWFPNCGKRRLSEVARK